MAVDGPGDDVEAVGVDLALAVEPFADGGDALAGDAEVGDERAVRGDESTAPDDQVAVHAAASSMSRESRMGDGPVMTMFVVRRGCGGFAGRPDHGIISAGADSSADRAQPLQG